MRLWRKRIHGIECLLPVGSVDFGAIFRSPSSNEEWPTVAARIDAITQIEDGKTGGVNPGDRRALYYLTRWLKPISVLEIGTHVGASTLYIAGALKHQESAKLTTVDIEDVNVTDGPWSKAGLARSPGEAMAELGVSANFIRAHSISFFDGTPDKFDFIFLDGDHSRNTVSAEIPRALNHLNENGLVLLHDYFPNGGALWKEEPPIEGPYIAVQNLQRDGANIAAVPLGALPWPTKHGTNLTSLAALLAP